MSHLTKKGILFFLIHIKIYPKDGLLYIVSKSIDMLQYILIYDVSGLFIENVNITKNLAGYIIEIGNI